MSRVVKHELKIVLYAKFTHTTHGSIRAVHWARQTHEAPALV